MLLYSVREQQLRNCIPVGYIWIWLGHVTKNQLITVLVLEKGQMKANKSIAIASWNHFILLRREVNYKNILAYIDCIESEA